MVCKSENCRVPLLENVLQHVVIVPKLVTIGILFLLDTSSSSVMEIENLVLKKVFFFLNKKKTTKKKNMNFRVKNKS